MESLQSSALKVLRKLQKRLKKVIPKRPKQKARKKLFNISSIVLLVGTTLVIYGGVSYYKVRTLSFSSTPPEVISSVEDIDIPVEIIIPSINLDLKVEPGQIKNGVWQVSESNATFLNSSATPGSFGNTVIYAHNKKVIFGNLPYLSVGQEIHIKTKSGKTYKYTTVEKYFVNPSRVDLVSQGKKEELTLFTCWGAFDSERVVIKASPDI